MEASRIKRLKSSLRSSKDVTKAIYEAGFGSPSRVERADTRLGMTPMQYRERGRNVVITHVTVLSPVGPMMIAARDRGLSFVQLEESQAALLKALKKEYPAAKREEMNKPYPVEFERWIRTLTSHIAGGQSHLDLPLGSHDGNQTICMNFSRILPYPHGSPSRIRRCKELRTTTRQHGE
jgi:AraC family transcriptional regulator, regulatory protein of adaptative response / methylated-DNA-[protein]-cysteine methyltransferase